VRPRQVVILNRFGLGQVRYADWLGDRVAAYMITSRSGLDGGRVPTGYLGVEVLDDYNENPLVEHRVLALHERHRFDRLLALSEFDLLRAARLREALGIPGQGTDSALAYRDKARMKALLAANGIPVVAHSAVHNAVDLTRFVERVGYPIVVKPRRGAGSVGVTRLDDAASLTGYLATEPALRTDTGAYLIAERYLEHRLYHVDGLVIDGRIVLIWPAEMTSCLEFYSGRTISSALLAPDDPLRAPLERLVSRAIMALPTPPATIFHAEVFRTPDGELLLNEIACRLGGGRIKAAVRLAFGVDLVELCVRAELLGPDALPAVPRVPSQLSGHVLFPPTRGVVAAVPGGCPVPGVHTFEFTKRVGDVISEPTSSVDALAMATVTGGTRAEVLRAIDDVITWYTASVRIVPSDDNEPATVGLSHPRAGKEDG
jgi:hypothetical protein